MIQLENCVKRFGKLILDELKDMEIKTWVAGGAVRDYFQSIEIKSDIDLYFQNQKDFDKCKTYLIKTEGKIYFENEKVIKIERNKLKLDLVKTFFASPGFCIGEFDFTVCCAAVDFERVYYNNTFFIDLAKKQLMINKLNYPISTLWRLQKYNWKGFKICKGELTKIVEAIQNTPKINELIPVDNMFDEFQSDSNLFMGID